jgi:hypothetical protein
MREDSKKPFKNCLDPHPAFLGGMRDLIRHLDIESNFSMIIKIKSLRTSLEIA